MLWQARQGLISGRSAIDAVGNSAEASQFLTRTSGLDATHINAYIALIDGLVADGIWAKLDALHIYATDTSSNALLNLVSSSFAATALNSPTFTADRGYTGVSASTSVFVNTNFNPSTASSPQFTRNSAHFSAWSATNVAAENHPIMGNIISGTVESTIYPRFLTDGKAYFRVNDSGALAGVIQASSQGHYIANRSSSTDGQGYKNGSSIVTTTSDNSIAVPNQTYYVCGMHINNGAAVGSAHQVAMSSIGSSLNSTEAGNLYTRLRTYMTAVGVP